MAVKVFISWSGSSSKRFAEILRQWLPSVIQAVRPYHSSEDISKGARWSAEIARELEQSKVGILCLTKDNLKEPWIMFEAGALSKNVGKARVCPILFGVDTTDLVGPLLQFQACRFEKSDFLDLVTTINKEADDNALPENVLTRVFNKFWDDIKQDIEGLLPTDDEIAGEEIRSDRDILEEVLGLSRAVASAVQSPRVSPSALRDLVRNYDAIVHFAVNSDEDYVAPLIDILMSMNASLEHLIRSATGSRTSSLFTVLRQAEAALNDWVVQRRQRRASETIDINESDFEDIPF